VAAATFPVAEAGDVVQQDGLALRGRLAFELAQDGPARVAPDDRLLGRLRARAARLDLATDPVRREIGHAAGAQAVQRAAARHHPHERAQRAALGVVHLGTGPQRREDLLHDVLRGRGVAEDRGGRRESGRREGAIAGGEGLGIAEVERFWE
jgi:hypothetical protein